VQNTLSSRLMVGLAQAGIAAGASIFVVLLAHRRKIHIEYDLLTALVRGLVQIVAVGSVLVLLLRGPKWTSGIMLAGMMFAAATTSSRRTKVPGAFRVSLQAISAGAGSVIAVMTLARVIDSAITSVIPVGSMLVANAMNTNSLALNRFKADVQSHVGQIESALALGTVAEQTVMPYVEASFRASLIPAVDSLRSLGIVWIPGPDGRHGSFRSASALLSHLSVCCSSYDLRRLGLDIPNQHDADSQACIQFGGTALAPARNSWSEFDLGDLVLELIAMIACRLSSRKGTSSVGAVPRTPITSTDGSGGMSGQRQSYRSSCDLFPTPV
jgi:putative ABC transport system permease protein